MLQLLRSPITNSEKEPALEGAALWSLWTAVPSKLLDEHHCSDHAAHGSSQERQDPHRHHALSANLVRASSQAGLAIQNHPQTTYSVSRYRYQALLDYPPIQDRAEGDANALAYTLCNWRHHGEDRADFARTWKVDPFSSGAVYTGWKELEDSPVLWPLPPRYLPLLVLRPRTWLLQSWHQFHPRISVREVPGN